MNGLFVYRLSKEWWSSDRLLVYWNL